MYVGAQSDLQELVTLSGNNCSMVCGAGVDGVGVSITGTHCLLDGGGWDTIMDGGTDRYAIEIEGATRCIVKNISAQTSAGSGNNLAAILMNGGYSTVDSCRIVDSDREGINITQTDCKVINNRIEGADNEGIRINNQRAIVVGNYVLSAGGDGIRGTNSADNSLIVGNTVKDQSGDSIEITAGGEDCCIVGNRVDGAVNDLSGTSTVADNDAEAF